MSNVLMVPIYLDALLLEVEQPVVEAMADFTSLPYSDGTGDFNPDIAYISEEIVSKPFQNENLFLKAGIHLHWALPDALTNGTQNSDGTTFPAVPNRWLVTRSNLDEQGQLTTDKQWIIESDYLYPDSAATQTGSVSISNPAFQQGSRNPPFRFLGRKMPLTAWQETDAAAEYLTPLTAVGYGEPAFAAFYPNCHSVFGFHDEDYTDPTADELQALQYDVIGWYADESLDFLATIINGVTEDFQKQGKGVPSENDLKEALEDQAQWTYLSDEGEAFPSQMLCFARLNFQESGGSIENPARLDSHTVITVANTGTEALSAYLAYTIVKNQTPEGAGQIDLDQKSQIEDQLESVQFSDRLESQQLDIGAKFVEARHEKGFTSVSGGFLWTINSETEETEANADSADAQAQITLPTDLAHKLNTLNLCQQQYDRALEQIESMRGQLFSDWYKYLLCAYPPEDSRDDYPDIDEVRNFIEVKGITSLQRRLETTGNLIIETDGEQVIATLSNSSAESLAGQLKSAIDALQQAVNEHNASPEVLAAKTTYKLKQFPSPRYWQPNEPVVLMTGPTVKPTPRHGADGLLACELLKDEEVADLLPSRVDVVRGRMDDIKPATGEEKTGFETWTQQPWNPFLLEWEVEVFPIESGSNVDPLNGSYAHSFITDNFSLDENNVDLSVKSGKGAVTRAANVYDGSSILTDYASAQLTDDLADYLEKQILDQYYKSQSVPQSEQTETYFSEHTAEILQWYKQSYCNQAENPATCNLITAYELLTASDFYSLSQALGGFNDALLMHKQTMQLSIADPLAFEEYQAFAASVGDAVQESIRSAPEPLDDFNPIRSGALKITRLRLVDTFGQVKELDCANVITTQQMTLPENSYLMMLPPRIIQPARLNLRWLSAAQNDLEMNDHPATSPICGWVLPNNLDGSLMIYDDAGKALGSINRLAHWEAAPGSNAVIEAEEIANPHLKKMVAYILDRGRDFLSHFISTIDNALENIEPENYAQHQDLALLIGSPIALVRASLNLELQGLTAVHQGWEAFRQDLERINRETSHFEHVEFPVRIGEYKQYNDGLVGYWKEDGDTYADDLFYAPQTDYISDPYIKTHADDAMTVYQTLKSESQTLVMLMEPRGEVHATAGAVPCKAINIPPDQYTDALHVIEVTFFSAPVLTALGEINLPLSNEPGYKWSWLEKESGSWSETSSSGIVTKQTFLDSFANGEDVWSRLKTKGWIQEIDAATASVTAKDKRTDPDLGADMNDEVPQIEIILSRAHIGQVELEATFSGAQGAREGWLKLSAADEADASTTDS